MNLILWRHADAHDAVVGGDDLSRPLTAKGERQAARMAEWLNQRLAESTRIVVSPALRCQQTARALGRKFTAVQELAPGASGSAVLAAARWPDVDEPVLVVGHQPSLGLAAALALTGREDYWQVKKAAAWWLRRRLHDGEQQVVLESVQSADGL
ncbi:MAG: histidine phosphatase family protein [Pseudomonadota bacterium]|nr:histidine phosphatase family protein [Pseudomonadota bacterium]